MVCRRGWATWQDIKKLANPEELKNCHCTGALRTNSGGEATIKPLSSHKKLPHSLALQTAEDEVVRSEDQEEPSLREGPGRVGRDVGTCPDNLHTRTCLEIVLEMTDHGRHF